MTWTQIAVTYCLVAYSTVYATFKAESSPESSSEYFWSWLLLSPIIYAGCVIHEVYHTGKRIVSVVFNPVKDTRP